MKFLNLFILLFLVVSLLKSDQPQTYSIGFLDVKEDLRYTKWGIHPVDIRSKLNKEKRAFQGAKLGIQDSMKVIRLTKTKLILERVNKNNYDEALKFLESEESNKFNSILLDINI